MCERSVARAVLVAACVLAAAHPAAAQSATRAAAAQRAAIARARIDSLLPLLEQARADAERRSAEARRAELAAVGKLDTVAVGPLLVVGRRRAFTVAVPLVRRVWSEYEPLLGGGAASRFSGVTLLVEGDQRGELTGELTRRPRHYRIRLSVSADQRDDYPESQVRGALNAALFALLPASVQRWLGDGYVAEQQHARTYRELVLANSIGAERCLQRSVAACAAQLGVTDAGADWSAWYTREQLQDLARDHRLGLAGPAHYRCVQAGVPDACVAAFASAGGPPPPLGQHARASFLHHVLLQGGAGSLERLIADGAVDARTALTRASGGAVESAIAAWLEAVVRARPTTYADLGRSLLITTLWCGLFLTLALRSTRWRIG